MPFGASYSCYVDLTEDACNARLEEENGMFCIMRLTSFLPGVRLLRSLVNSSENLFSIGQFVGPVGFYGAKANHEREKLLFKAV